MSLYVPVYRLRPLLHRLRPPAKCGAKCGAKCHIPCQWVVYPLMFRSCFCRLTPDGYSLAPPASVGPLLLDRWCALGPKACGFIASELWLSGLSSAFLRKKSEREHLRWFSLGLPCSGGPLDIWGYDLLFQA